jgi:hypothetical protein
MELMLNETVDLIEWVKKRDKSTVETVETASAGAGPDEAEK